MNKLQARIPGTDDGTLIAVQRGVDTKTWCSGPNDVVESQLSCFD
jgi:hypothetical protein